MPEEVCLSIIYPVHFLLIILLQDAFIPRAEVEMSECTLGPEEVDEKEDESQEEGEGECWLLQLPVENLLYIMQYLQCKQDIISAARTCTDLASVVMEYCLLELQQSVMCFHSKRTHKEDVLGVGISLEHYPK